MKRALVFIDGNAFKHYLREECSNAFDHFFRFKDFCDALVKGENENEELVRIYYYCALPTEFFPDMSEVEKERTGKILDARKKFVNFIQKSGNIDVELGHTRFKGRTDKNTPIFEEKGVDVKLSSDITKYTFIGNYDVFYVLTADNDIAYCMKTARDFGKIVKWVDIGTGDKYNGAILNKEADKKIDLDMQMVKKFTSKPPKK